MSQFMPNIMDLLYLVPAILLALTVHEYAHAYISYRLGDPTPATDGRLSLNPLHHLDPMGTLMLLLFRFGWSGGQFYFGLYQYAGIDRFTKAGHQ